MAVLSRHALTAHEQHVATQRCNNVSELLLPGRSVGIGAALGPFTVGVEQPTPWAFRLPTAADPLYSRPPVP